MEDSSCPTVPSRSNTDMYKLNKELERVIEDVEDISVQLTWMAYDMVTLRTGFEGEACMRELQEATCDVGTGTWGVILFALKKKK
uniref:Synaptonemal complex central element protein 3 n=1 Tax=Poecilia mexicana TaxID=48701 RepID=A0A3B3Z1H7_9TELE